MDSSNGIFMIGGLRVEAKTFEAVLCVAVVVVMARLEVFRRAVDDRPGETSPPTEKYKRLLRECAPEAAGTLACIALVLALRCRGDTLSESMDEGNREAWEAIKEQWPLLMTADTLLAIQVMMRVVVVLSAVLRSGSGKVSPVADECAMMWLGGSIARTTNLMQSGAYWLEGPAGGIIPTAFEVALVPLLLILGQRALRRSPLTALMVVGLVSAFSQRNYLSLAEEQNVNMLFTAAHSFEFLAAFAFVARTMFIDNDGVAGNEVSIAFMHLVMPVQQGLAVYFWLQAFEPDANLTGSGLGIVAIQVSCVAQLGAYLAAAALHTATWFADQQPQRPLSAVL